MLSARNRLWIAFLPVLLVLLGIAGCSSATTNETKPTGKTTCIENWPIWRGPNHNGTTSATGLPTKWNETIDKETGKRETSNIVWTCDLPEYGRSTPVVWGDAIFLTSQEGEKLFLLKINAQNGETEWTREVGYGVPEQSAAVGKKGDQRRHQRFHNEHNMASPSCTTDGELVVTHFGNGDLAAYDFDGNQLWKLNLQEKYGDYTIWWGHANSPILCGDSLIIMTIQDDCRDLEGELSESYVAALDRKTGKELWRTLRVTEAEKEHCDSYCTPVLRKMPDRSELIILGGEILDAYDLKTGRRTWFFPKFVGNRPVTGPIADGDIIFATHGKSGSMVALKPEGSGQQSEEKQALWTREKKTPDSSWPVIVGDLLFYVTDNGNAHCLNKNTGEVLWTKKLKGIPFRASLLTDGKNVYFTGVRGVITVIRAADELKVVAENRLDDKLYASPVVWGDRILLRGKKRLYCIGK